MLFSLITVGFASNELGGAGGPLAVYFVAIIVAEAGYCSQMGNIIKNPSIWIAPIVTSAIIEFDWAGMM